MPGRALIRGEWPLALARRKHDAFLGDAVGHDELGQGNLNSCLRWVALVPVGNLVAVPILARGPPFALLRSTQQIMWCCHRAWVLKDLLRIRSLIRLAELLSAASRRVAQSIARVILGHRGTLDMLVVQRAGPVLFMALINSICPLTLS